MKKVYKIKIRESIAPMDKAEWDEAFWPTNHLPLVLNHSILILSGIAFGQGRIRPSLDIGLSELQRTDSDKHKTCWQ